MAISRFQWNKGDKILGKSDSVRGSNLSLMQNTEPFDEHDELADGYSFSVGDIY